MRRFLIAVFAFATALACLGQIVIGNNTYSVDTLFRRQVGPGMVTTIVRLSDFPLNVYVTETDLNNPNNRIETTLGYSTVGRTESLLNAVKRNRTATRRPIVACNSNFWCVSSEWPPRDFELSTPYCSVIRNDSIYVNAETNEDNWCYGPGYTGGTAISRDKTLYFDHIIPSATITGEKLTAPIIFETVNRRCMLNHVTLWTPAYTRTRQFETDWINAGERGNAHTDNYYLTLKPGERWGINHDMTFTIAKIVRDADRQTLGEYDACLTCSGSQSDVMAVLAQGDEITINYGMTVQGSGDNANLKPEIENMVEGIGLVMKNGELTQNNYDLDYNTKVYSRTGYGASADGKRLVMMVIDMSTSKKYGRSAGCNTETMCLIMSQLCPYVSNITTMDAGGSAMMIVGDECISTTTEGNPRAVACGWMVEAVGEEDNTVASIAFDDFKVQAPIYSSYVPRILGYNAIGELVDDNVQGFTLTCDENIGSTEGNTYIAAGQAVHGTLTAHLGDMTATVPVTTLMAQPAIKVKPLLIDNRPYPIEVTAMVNGNTYFYDPSKLNWNVDDPSVASIEEGILKPERNGNTLISCQIGEFLDQDSVTVEISSVPYIYQDWDGWTLKASGAKDLALDSDGTLSFTYNSGRAPYISLKKDLTFYSLPDTIAITFNASIPIDYVQIDTRNRYATGMNYIKYEPDGGYQPGIDHTVQFNLDLLGGARQVGTYPIMVKELRFIPSKTGETGAQSIQIKSFYSHYSNVIALNGDVDANGRVNVSDVTALVNMILGITSMDKSKADVDGNGQVNVSDVTALVNIILGQSFSHASSRKVVY
ncbi:MAG: phosphodiester glycosidase family protein [Muribaculaceae bacterium]|nr:phosphodiester glycosidase family protein [Muribaculaceae bacterium]